MLATDYSFIFIQPPKTATTSIREWLMERDLVPKDGGPFKRHSKAMDIKKAINPTIWNSAVKFTVLRCPYDRLVSYYLYCVKLATTPSDAVKGTQHTKLAEEWISRCKNFHEFVDLIFTSDRLNQYILRSTQYEFYGKCLDEMHILNMDRLDKDFEELCNKIDQPHAPLPVYNISFDREDVWSYYDEPTKNKVTKLLKRDIEMFNKYQHSN